MKAEKVLQLSDKDDDGNSAGESGNEGLRNELDHCTESGKSHHQQDDAGHQRRDGESLNPILLHDAVDDHHKGARGSSDLNPGTSQRRDEKSTHDGSVEPTLGRHPARNREGDGQRQGDNTDDGSRRNVGQQLMSIVVLECRDELRDEHGCGG